ncbi:MAG: PQQ-binding-like beta-propeller repeat protein [Planctomycetes bacterium]|nr:PQQ-binding-like beta-propeller repeat protein [Planctomycetota bacterium]
MNCRRWKQMLFVSAFTGLLLGSFLGASAIWLLPGSKGRDSPVSFAERIQDARRATSLKQYWAAITGETAIERREFERWADAVLMSMGRGPMEHLELEIGLAFPLKQEQTSPFSMFGGTPARNMVNLIDKNLPTHFCGEDKKHKNVKWVANLGSHSYGGPVVAGGRVFVGTNNAAPRDPKDKGRNKAVLMAFNEADGKFLWQAVHNTPDEDTFAQAAIHGLLAAPAVEGDKLYYVTPACEVVCASVKDGKAAWLLAMRKEFKVSPYHCSNCSPLIHGDLVFVVTGNGMDDQGEIRAPEAPSFLAVNKSTGEAVWQSNLPGKNIIEGQWSNPALAKVNGKDMVIFPGGDAVLYGFEAKSGELLWKCNCNPQPEKDGKNYFVATPVVVGTKLYVGLGQYPDNPQPTRHSYVVCLDLTGKGDVSPKTMNASDAGNKGSALVWSFGGPIVPRPKKGRTVYFGRTISTCAVHEGLLYIAEENNDFYCLDANTGKLLWTHETSADHWASPFFADSKIYLGTGAASVVVFAHGKENKVLAENDMDSRVLATPTASGNVLFVMTEQKLWALHNKQ